MKPSFKELFTKVYVSYQGMDPHFVYYLDEDDYQIKRIEKKRFLDFERNFMSKDFRKDGNSEENLMMNLALSNGKYILPKTFSDKEFDAYYEESNKDVPLESIKDMILTRIIQVWLDFHNLYTIEADETYYQEVFYFLAMVFNAHLFDFFPKNNILHYQDGEGQNFYYVFNRKDLSFTLTDNYLGLSNMQCMISSPNAFDKNILRTLRKSFVITFKKENRCTQDTISLYEKYESKDVDFGAFVPKITCYEDGLITENGLRMSQAQILALMLSSLVTLVNTLVEQKIYPEPGKCYIYKNNSHEVGVDPDVDLISKSPFINLIPYHQACFGVIQNKINAVELKLRVMSFKKISSRAKAAVYECLIVNHETGELLERVEVKASKTTINDLMQQLIEYAYRNGWAERTVVDSPLDFHLANVLSGGKTRIEYDELLQINRLDEDEDDSVNISA